MWQNLKSKNGVAIEMAITFSLVVFALCTIITTIVFSVRYKDRFTSNRMNDSYVIDQIGEYFIRYMSGEESAIGTGGGTDADTEIENGWIRYNKFGMRIDTSTVNPAISTMRIIDWNQAKNENPPVKLIVTVKQNTTGVDVLNWSDQECELASSKDVIPQEETQNRSLMKRMATLLRNVINIIIHY